ncbi:MAG: hypothetical protein ACE14L_17405 [Terriglobales bacterium]
MDEEMTNQFADTAGRLAAAAEALEKALGRLEAQQQAMEQKVQRIVAAIDERAAEYQAEETRRLQQRVAELERENGELRASVSQARATRKTLSPLVSTLLTKSCGYEEGTRMDAGALEKALASLSLEQRIAVKAEMARAGMIE